MKTVFSVGRIEKYFFTFSVSVLTFDKCKQLQVNTSMQTCLDIFMILFQQNTCVVEKDLEELGVFLYLRVPSVLNAYLLFTVRSVDDMQIMTDEC